MGLGKKEVHKFIAYRADDLKLESAREVEVVVEKKAPLKAELVAEKLGKQLEMLHEELGGSPRAFTVYELKAPMQWEVEVTTRMVKRHG